LSPMGKAAKIKGYAKTKHFVERQGQRNVSDKQVEKVLNKGSYSENEEGYLVYRWKEFTVVTDPISECLVTVHADGHNIKSAKVLSLDVAREIKAEIASYEEIFGQAITNDFYMEMHRERVKVMAEADDEEEGEVISLEDYLGKKSA
jgi:homoserine acetyltransferase